MLFITISYTMKQCDICGKGYAMAGKRNKLRGKYNPTAMKKRYPNLQKTRNLDGKRVSACTQCIKTLNKKTEKSGI